MKNDLADKRFGRLTVLRYAGKKDRRNHLWLCRCDCGTEKVVIGGNLLRGNTRSCGCLKREIHTSHGAWGNPTYVSWNTMLQRCLNHRKPAYRRYGGRGITVCERWRRFENFLADMGERPAGRTLDRYPDKDGNYEPGNCRWATPTEQANNTKRNVWVEFRGERKTIAQWARELSMKENTLRRRLCHSQSIEEVR